MNTRTERSYGMNGYVDIQVPYFPNLGTIAETARGLKENVIQLGTANLLCAALCYAIAQMPDECHSCLRGEIGRVIA